MKRPLRRLGTAVIVMIGLLLANIAYTQVIKADDYRADPNNKRTLVAEYSRQRGQITAAGGVVLARSDPVDDQYSYQRVYPGGATYADLTGYYSMRYGPTGLERNQNEILSGEAPELIAGQLSDLITGRDPRGGNVELNIQPAVQQAAYTAMTEKNYVGAVVAIEPSTGKVLAMVSTPSYDPNPLASHSDAVQRQAYNDLVNADPSPLLNRAIAAVYPPGSTFKLVIAAAALQQGYTPQTPVTGEAKITLPDTGGATLSNFAGETCGDGGGADVPLIEALAFSCNTAFAEVAMSLGVVPVRKQAEALGDRQPGPGHRARRRRLPARRHPGHRRARADRHRAAGRRGDPVPDGLDHRDHRQPRRQDGAAPDREDHQAGPDGDLRDPAGVAGPGDPDRRRRPGARHDDRVREGHPRFRRHRRPGDRLQDRHRRARHRSEEHSAARLVRGVRTRRQSDRSRSR